MPIPKTVTKILTKLPFTTSMQVQLNMDTMLEMVTITGQINTLIKLLEWYQFKVLK